MTGEFHSEYGAGAELEKALFKTLSPEQQRVFRDFLDRLTAAASIENEQAFRKGFKCGIRMIIEGLL